MIQILLHDYYPIVHLVNEKEMIEMDVNYNQNNVNEASGSNFYNTQNQINNENYNNTYDHNFDNNEIDMMGGIENKNEKEEKEEIGDCNKNQNEEKNAKEITEEEFVNNDNDIVNKENILYIKEVIQLTHLIHNNI